MSPQSEDPFKDIFDAFILNKESNFSSIEIIELEKAPSSILDERAFSSAKITQEDLRKNFKTGIAGMLAFLLWLVLAGVVAWHLIAISRISQILLEDQYRSISSKVPVEEVMTRFEKTSTLIGDTAKTLYAILGPLVTAATGFYFSKTSSENPENK